MFLRLDGPSGTLYAYGHWVGAGTWAPPTVDRRVLRSLTQFHIPTISYDRKAHDCTMPCTLPKYKKPKKHNAIPFRSPLDPSKISKKSKLTQLQYIASHHKPNTERTNPFSIHAAPWAPDIYSPPFITKIRIIADPPKGGKTPEERAEHKTALKSLQASHNLAFYAS